MTKPSLMPIPSTGRDVTPKRERKSRLEWTSSAIICSQQMSLRFAAIDFETANERMDSACALAVLRVWDDAIEEQAVRLIRPPTTRFTNSRVHGIGWSEVKDEPPFRQVWEEIRPLLDGVQFVAAHNASFDSAMLAACCQAAKILAPQIPFLCTVRLARDAWGITPTRLPDVCDRLGISLDHHNALSDAEACARIVLAADLKVRRKAQTGKPYLWLENRPLLKLWKEL